MSDWHPMGTPRGGRRTRPGVGAVVAYDRRAWEVRHIDDAEPTDDERERLAGYTQPFRDQMQPYRVTLRRLHGAQHERENSAGDIGLRVRAAAYDPLPEYPDGRVPLCSCHSEPWPCLEADQQAQAAKELRAAERVLRVLPGCCPACEEPVTSRQKAITFGGPNVRNPLAEGPTFHLRKKCWGAAARYEEAWVADEPGRARSLLTLACSGTVIVHHDGTAECFGAEGSDCPTVHAHHRCYSACFLQSHGCGRGCPRAGHPGTRLAGRPTDPRAITRVEPS
jgi:hypothetical protein